MSVMRLPLWYYWLRSRYARPNAFVACRTCPNWLYHSRVEMEPGPAGRETISSHVHPEPFHDAGLCKLDAPRVFNDFTTGYALKIWTANDSCTRHPLYDATVLDMASDLRYRPGDESTAGAAGFSRLPSLAEALKMSHAGQVKPGEPVPPRPNASEKKRETGFKLDPRIRMGSGIEFEKDSERKS